MAQYLIEHSEPSTTANPPHLVPQSRLFLENAEWEDSTQTVLRIMWKTPEALALDIYEWASKKEVLGTVYTFYELLSGDEYTDSGKISLYLSYFSNL